MRRNGGFKRLISMILLILVMFIPGCKTNKDMDVVDEPIELEKISDDFKLQDAKDAGMLVIEDMIITNGLSRWNTFLNNVTQGLSDTIYIAKYYEIGEESQYDPALYEEIKNDYPMLFISKLFYDGKKYTLEYYEESQLFTYEYTYLLERVGWFGGSAQIAEHFFVLANEEDLSYRDIVWSGFSSNSDDWVDAHNVFTERVSLEEYNNRKPGVYETENGLASLTLREDCHFSFNRNIATSYDPAGRYYVEEKVLILYVSEEEEYRFKMIGDGTLEFLSGKYAEGLVPIGTKFYIVP